MKLYHIPKVKGKACSLHVRPQVKLARGKGIYATSEGVVQVKPTREVDMSHVGRALQALHVAKPSRKVRL